MNAFRQLREARASSGQKRLPPVSNATPWTVGTPGAYRDSLDAFLAQRRSRTPSFISYDKINMAQNMAGAIYLPITFAARQFSRSKVVIYQHDYETEEGKSKVPFSNRALYRMFTSHPNPNDTFSDILYSLSQQYDICGECYLWMPPTDSRTGEVSEFGEPQEFYVIPSAWVSGLPSCPWWEGGAYQVTPYVSQYPGSTQSAFIPADQMLRIYDPHPLFDKTGYSVLQAISQCVDTVRSIDQSRASVQENGNQQTLAFSLDPQLIQAGHADLKRVKETFQQAMAGTQNAGKAMFLPPGVTPVPISSAPYEMAWQEGWTQLTDFVFATYGTNRAALGMSGDLNFATLYASIKQLYWSKLEPRTEQFGGRFTKDYFDPYYGEEYFCEFELPAMDEETQKLARLKLLTDTSAITYGMLLQDLGYEVDAKKTPWLNDRVKSQPAPKPAGAEGEPQEEATKDPAVEAARPRNALGEGSLGSRVKGLPQMGHGVDESKLYGVLDRELTRGRITNGNGKH